MSIDRATPPLPQRGLYAITPDKLESVAALCDATAAVLAGGAALLQYRDKHSTAEQRHRIAELLRLQTTSHGVPLIINDDPELALAVNAEGVHIGQDDGEATAVRQRVGPEMILGVSCYDSLERAHQAQRQGADYVAFGSLFPSPTKPKARRASLTLIIQAQTQLAVPIVAIGGITPENGAQAIAAGADFLAVIDGVYDQPNPKAAAQRFHGLFET